MNAFILLRYYSVLVLSRAYGKRFVKFCDAISYVTCLGISVIIKGNYLSEFFQCILERARAARGKDGVRPGIKT
jgi:hypothetical protein